MGLADANDEVDREPAPPARTPKIETAPDGGGPLGPAEIAQEEVVRLRSRLLGGRGPGASEQEVDRETRDRPTVGGIPTTIERELVQVRAEFARGDADAIELDLERVRAGLTAALDEFAARLAPRRLTTQAIQISVPAAALGAAAALVLGLLVRTASRRLAQRPAARLGSSPVATGPAHLPAGRRQRRRVRTRHPPALG